MEELKFLAIENIFEEVREEVLYIKMKHLGSYVYLFEK